MHSLGYNTFYINILIHYLIMGFWKEVSMDVQRGMTIEKATALNAELRYGKHTKEEKEKLVAEAEASIKLNSMK